MNVWLRGAAVTVAAVIALSLAGLADVASGVGLLGGLLTVLFGLVSGGRVRGGRTARSLPQLGRYKVSVVAGAIIGGFTAAGLLEALSLPTTAPLMLAVAASGVVFGAFRIAREIVGLASGGVAIALLFGVGACDSGIDVASLTSAIVVVVVVGTTMLVVARGLFGIASPLPRRVDRWERLATLAGVIELATFVGRPFGVSIWGDAPAGAQWLAGGLLAVIGVGLGFGARIVLGLVAAALATASVYVVVTGVADGARCAPTYATLVVPALFAAAAAVGSAISA